ncbi:disease resistance protein RPS5 [Vigna unguiculata]|uniref:Disease resistance protein RPS5 n=1 Tax=Vigna unguiculata TaxID=3917 RepID=A0A4D6MK00_VIGUN|nr:disease resistance protein RPS5 [Vigna unguiculata]
MMSLSRDCRVYLHLKYIEGGYKNVIPSMRSQGMNQIVALILEHCHDIEFLFDGTAITNNNVDMLHTKTVFSNLVAEGNDDYVRTQYHTYLMLPKLRIIEIEGCHKLKYIFPACFGRLPSLERLITKNCDKLKYVFGTEKEHHLSMYHEYPDLLNLEVLMLVSLPNLVDIWPSHCHPRLPNLKELQCIECSTLSNSSLRKMAIDSGKIVEYTLGSVCGCYINDFTSKFQDAKEKLELTRENMKEQIRETTNGTENFEPAFLKHVENLLKVAEKVLEEVQFLEERISNVNKSYFRRQRLYFLAKEIERETDKMFELLYFTKIESLSRITELSNDLGAFKSTEEAYTEILAALKDRSVSMIGLVGVGGSGKTSLAKEIGKKAEEMKLFEKVVMATVSQPINIRSIQDQIADQLGFKLMEESDIGRAQRLSERLRKGTTFLILDDVWEKLNFQALGIPFDNSKACCIFLTTRSREVCTSMKCQNIIELNALTEGEAWALFTFHANISNDSPTDYNARRIVSECNGSSTAIVTIGSTLKGKTFEEFQLARLMLQQSKQLDIPKGLTSHQVKEKEKVKMRDSIRDLALWIAKAESGQAILTSTAVDPRVLVDDEVTKDKNVIALWDMTNGQLLNYEMNCPSLEVLLLHAPEVGFTISNAFLVRLKMLKLLAFLTFEYRWKLPLETETPLWYTSPLSQSIESLKNLNTLSFRGYKLGDISALVSLQALEILDLRGSSFKELPNGIVALQKLKLLDLYCCLIEKNNAYEVIGRCLRLEELYLHLFPSKKKFPHDVSFSRLQRYVIIQYRSESCPHYMHADVLEKHRPSRALCIDGFNASTQTFISLPNKNLFLRAVYLHLKYIEGGYKNVIPSMRSQGMNQIVALILEHCHDIEFLFDGTAITNNNVDMLHTKTVFSNLENLQELVINNCKKLYSISFPRNSKLCSLKELRIISCPVLTSLFMPFIAQTLKLLEVLQILECSELMHVIAVAEGNDDYVRTQYHTYLMLPKLRIIEIEGCHKLKYIFPACFGRLPSLERLITKNCDKLKYVFGTEKEHHLSMYHEYPDLLNLEVLMLVSLPNLVDIWPSHCHPRLPNLKELQCIECSTLSNSSLRKMAIDSGKIVEYTLGSVCGCYINDFTSKFQDAKEKLELTRENMKEQIRETTNGTENFEPAFLKHVENLLKVAEKVLEEVQFLEERISNVNKSYFRRQRLYFLAKEIERETDKMFELLYFTKIESLSRITELSNDLGAFKSTEEAYTEILAALKDRSVSMIGLVGVGGSGKTSLAKEIGKKAEEMKLFEKVVMATVSQPINIRSIQDQIADQLGFKLMEESDIGRAQRLSERLRKGTTFLILDDVWEKLNFQALGIPFDNSKACCIFLTTRSREVCTSMKCQNIIELNALTEGEAWALFTFHANISNDSPTDYNARRIVSECNGSSTAIVTIGSTLKGKTFEEFQLARLMLQQSKQLDIPKGLTSHQVKEKEKVKMRDSIRDLALWIAKAESGQAILTSTAVDPRVLVDDEVTKDKNVIALWDMTNGQLLNYEMNCPSLEVLLLHAPEVGFTISNAFLVRLKMLKLLAFLTFEYRWKLPLETETPLWYTSPLSQSIESLKNLNTLSFRGYKLGDISALVSLQALEILDLRGSSFKELPNGIVALQKLKLLDLYCCLIEKNNAYEVIGRCLRLEELYLHLFPSKKKFPHDVSFSRLQRYVIIQYRSESCPHYMHADVLEKHRPSRALCIDGFNASTQTFISLPNKNLFLRAVYLHLKYIEGGYKNVIPSMRSQGMNQIVALILEHCHDIEFLFDGTAITNNNVDMLHTKTVFSNLVAEGNDDYVRTQYHTYLMLPKLRIIEIEGCHKLKYIFPACFGRLPSLERLITKNCDKLKYVFGTEKEHHLSMYHEYPDLLNLEVLMLVSLPNLVDIWPSHCHPRLPNLKELQCIECSTLSNSSLRKMAIDSGLHHQGTTAMGMHKNSKVYLLVPNKCASLNWSRSKFKRATC